MWKILLLLPIALTAGCGSDGDPGPGGVTVGEAKALDDAAEMIEQSRPELPANATEQTDTQNQEEQR